MNEVFLKIVGMSFTASWLILAVIIARCFLSRYSKRITCFLWWLVAVRLICPFTVESALSLMPSMDAIRSNMSIQNGNSLNSEIEIVENISDYEAAKETSTHIFKTSSVSFEFACLVLSGIWIVGIAAMLAYMLFQYLKLKKSVIVCVSVGENVFACDEVKTPFIFGLFKPAIFVPSSMKEGTLGYVIKHETAHLQRLDHWWKSLGFLVLSFYWFNPLCWVAYVLFCRDIEMAADEKVVCNMDKEEVAEYAQALLDCSCSGNRIAVSALAFNETSVKKRVRSILEYKKPAILRMIISVAIFAAIIAFLMTDPIQSKNRELSEDYLNQFLVGELPGKLAQAQIKSMKTKLPSCRFIFSVVSAGGLENVSHTCRQKVRVKRVFEGDIMAGDEVYISSEGWFIDIDAEYPERAINRRFVNILQPDKEYLVFCEDKITSLFSIPVYRLYEDSVIAPVFCYEEIENIIVPVKDGEPTYVSYGSVRGNEFFACDAEALDEWNDLKEMMIQRYGRA